MDQLGLRHGPERIVAVEQSEKCLQRRFVAALQLHLEFLEGLQDPPVAHDLDFVQAQFGAGPTGLQIAETPQLADGQHLHQRFVAAKLQHHVSRMRGGPVAGLQVRVGRTLDLFTTLQPAAGYAQSLEAYRTPARSLAHSRRESGPGQGPVGRVYVAVLDPEGS